MRVRCVAPRFPAEHVGEDYEAGEDLVVAVSLSANGRDFVAGEGVEFSYTAMPAVTGVSPQKGPITGGSVVDVRGPELRR